MSVDNNSKCPVCESKDRDTAFSKLCAMCGWEHSTVVGRMPPALKDSRLAQKEIRKSVVENEKTLIPQLKEVRKKTKAVRKALRELSEQVQDQHGEISRSRSKLEMLKKHEALEFDLKKLELELKELESKDRTEIEYWSKEALLIEYRLSDQGVHIMLPSSVDSPPKMVLGISPRRSVRKISDAEFVIHLDYRQAVNRETRRGREMIVPLPVKVNTDYHYRLAQFAVKRQNQRLYQIIDTNNY